MEGRLLAIPCIRPPYHPNRRWTPLRRPAGYRLRIPHRGSNLPRRRNRAGVPKHCDISTGRSSRYPGQNPTGNCVGHIFPIDWWRCGHLDLWYSLQQPACEGARKTSCFDGDRRWSVPRSIPAAQLPYVLRALRPAVKITVQAIFVLPAELKATVLVSLARGVLFSRCPAAEPPSGPASPFLPSVRMATFELSPRLSLSPSPQPSSRLSRLFSSGESTLRRLASTWLLVGLPDLAHIVLLVLFSIPFSFLCLLL